MASNSAQIEGMIGSGKCFFLGSPVVIRVSNLGIPSSSPFKIVIVDIIHGGKTYGLVRGDTGGESSIEFNISSALRTMWAAENYDFDADGNEVTKANSAVGGTSDRKNRNILKYYLRVRTEYMYNGALVQTTGSEKDGGWCCLGSMTEWERSLATDNGENGVASLAPNNRFGNASTKPTSSPEHVGKDSITSWVGLAGNTGTSSPYNTVSHYYAAGKAMDSDQAGDHAPIVLRDSQEYVDFLFLNRRGAVETCSGLTLEAMDISVETKQYGRVERPTFKPSRSIMAIGSDGRREWNMSSGYVTREWAEWWTTEFLGGKRKRWWMRWKGPGMATAAYVPVIVEPAKKSTTVYDKAKQQMPHVDFTVTLALEG